MKQLTRLFPNKVTVQIPQVISIFASVWLWFFYFKMIVECFIHMLQDEAEIVDWKLKLDRDTETMKSQSNVGSIRSVSSFSPMRS